MSPLPDLVVIGAMKCGTSAVHEYLDAHPRVAMSDPKELNFFNGPESPPPDPDEWWRTGQWFRGVDWYAAQFDPDAQVRGEASPAYTSPSFPEVPGRMASVVPRAHLVYMVRDPVDRAVSQWAHHRRDGDETRGLAEAILDPDSQYVARSRYYERLEPFLAFYEASQVCVVAQERLAEDPATELGALFAHVGVDPDETPPPEPRPRPAEHGPVSPTLRAAFLERVADDLERLRDLIGDEFREWTPA